MNSVNSEDDEKREVAFTKEFKNFSQAQIDELFVLTCYKRDWQLVDFLLNSPRIPINAKIHGLYDAAFRYSLYEDKLDIIHHLIFELNIDMTPVMRDALNKQSQLFKDKIEKMFEVRDLNNDLQKKANCDKINKSEPAKSKI